MFPCTPLHPTTTLFGAANSLQRELLWTLWHHIRAKRVRLGVKTTRLKKTIELYPTSYSFDQRDTLTQGGFEIWTSKDSPPQRRASSKSRLLRGRFRSDVDIISCVLSAPERLTRQKEFRSPPWPCVRSDLRRGWSTPSRCRTTKPAAGQNANGETCKKQKERRKEKNKARAWGVSISVSRITKF